MARFDRGWVAISRRLFLDDEQANEFLGDMPLYCVWTLLIAWANIAPSRRKYGRLESLVPRGELLTSLGQIGAQWGIGVAVVRRCLDYLVRTQRISIVASTEGLHIKICKYEEYQNPNHADNKPNDTRPTRDQHVDDTRPTRDQQHIEPGNQSTKGPANQNGLPAAVPAPDVPPIGEARKTTRAKRPPPGPAKSAAVIEAYSLAFMAVHGDMPEPTAPVRSMACKLVDLVGADFAPAVAEYYVIHERAGWIMRDRHPFGELVRNAQKYLTNCRTGTKITASQARSVERDDGNRSAIDLHLARKYGNNPPNGV